MNLTNKLDITTVKYWMKDESTPIKSSLVEICDLQPIYAHKLKDQILEEIESMEWNLNSLNSGILSSIKKRIFASKINYLTKSIETKKELVNNLLSSCHPSEIFLVDRSKLDWDFNFIRNVWKYRDLTDTSIFTTKAFLEDRWIDSLVEITREQYITERQRIGDSKARWEAHSEKFDEEKKEIESSDESLGLAMLAFALIIVFTHGLLNKDEPNNKFNPFSMVNDKSYTENKCVITNTSASCEMRLINPSDRDIQQARVLESSSDSIHCSESKNENDFILSCKADFTERFSELKSLESARLKLDPSLSNEAFMQHLKQTSERVNPIFLKIMYFEKIKTGK